MKRNDAIARFGRHYEIDAGTKTIREKLCAADPESKHEFADLGAAIRALDAQVRKKGAKAAADAQKTLGRLGTRLLIARAKMGLHPKAAYILVKAAEYKEIVREGRHAADYGHDGQMTIYSLRDNIRMPHMLEIGRKIYEMKANYMTEGIRISELRVTGLRIYEGWSNGEYDYAVHYDAKGTRGSGGVQDFSFEYPHDDTSKTELKSPYGEQIRYFLTPEAADQAALDVMAKLKDNFNKVAADIRERRIERDHANTAPHYGLDL
jgi:hypothetical protein